jgi:hypothetical protein
VGQIGNRKQDARHVVANPKTLEVSLAVQLVNRLEGYLVRHGPVGTVEVPHLDLTVVRKINLAKS